MGQKRLYRNTNENDKMLAGVCVGIAEYFKLDPSIIRLLWIFLTLMFGTGIIVYIAAWIIVPEKQDLIEG